MRSRKNMSWGGPVVIAAAITVSGLGGCAGRSPEQSRAEKPGVAPVARPVIVVSAEARHPLALSLSLVDPHSFNALRWELDDGARLEGETPRHRFARGGTHEIVLRYEDLQGRRGTVRRRVDLNRPPTAVIEQVGIVSGSPGTALWFKPVAVDEDSERVRCRWTFGDGKHASGREVTHEYVREGHYEVTLIVNDSDGAETRDTVTVDVARIPPRSPTLIGRPEAPGEAPRVASNR